MKRHLTQLALGLGLNRGRREGVATPPHHNQVGLFYGRRWRKKNRGQQWKVP